MSQNSILPQKHRCLHLHKVSKDRKNLVPKNKVCLYCPPVHFVLLLVNVIAQENASGIHTLFPLLRDYPRVTHFATHVSLLSEH